MQNIAAKNIPMKRIKQKKEKQQKSIIKENMFVLCVEKHSLLANEKIFIAMSVK